MNPADFGLLSPVWAGTSVAAMTGDEVLVRAMLVVEQEWVATQVDAGLATDGEAQDVAAALEDFVPDLEALAASGADGANAFIPLLGQFRAALTQRRGAPVAALHRGATSQDVIDTAIVLVLVSAARRTLEDLRAASDALAGLATRHRSDVCMARSLTQHALPITLGHRFARWMLMLDDAAEVLHAAVASAPLQWGGAVGTSTSLLASVRGTGAREPENVTRSLVVELARRLHLQAPPTAWHTRRAPLLRFASALAEAVASAGKIASDVLLLARPEIRELAEPQAPGKGGSSAMPHKRNPVLSVLMKEAAVEAPGHLSTVFLAAGLAVDERPDGAWHAEWQALRSLARLAGGSAARLRELCEGLQVFPERAAQIANDFGLAVLGAAPSGDSLGLALHEVDELVATHHASKEHYA